MPAVFPFHAIQFRGGTGDLSAVVAPPYDVLDQDAKDALIAKDRANVVGFDLPHVPPKTLGPDAAYKAAAESFRGKLADGTLTKRSTPAMFAYRQRFEFLGETYDRCGMACCIETQDFGPREGGGVLPHEQTFGGPKEDRKALMKSTGAQLSPIFGLHEDAGGSASALVRSVMESRAPDATADMGDGVSHELWTIEDEATIAEYASALAGEDVFIADGHHRYTTAINYLRDLESSGDVPADHPARRTMIVLVGMSDPGLAIGPTHRVLGGMSGYSIDAFETASQGYLELNPCENDPAIIEREIANRAANEERNVFGIIDFATGLCFTATPSELDPLADEFGSKPEAWRRLDVAIIQHTIVEQICQPELNGGEPITWAFPHSIPEVMEIARGKETGAGGGSGFAQLGVVVRPTPLEAVREVSRAGEVMPQKSTFFYPKLATGLFMHDLTTG
ncbi:MAG: DUF1015 domain-containing protein [Planctomycetota bacterium]